MKIYGYIHTCFSFCWYVFSGGAVPYTYHHDRQVFSIPVKAFQCEKQAAFAALLAISLLGFHKSGFAEIPQGAADGGRGQLEIGRS